jgi:hypothetical protein
VSDLVDVRRAFETPEFGTSPLYRALCTTVAANGDLLKLASRGRPGQYPTFLFFGAVHYLLLQGAEHELASFYPSVVGENVRPIDGAGPALVRFCADYGDDLAALIEHRLVQTSHVQRALALRLGLHVIGRQVNEPVHLVEVGASAGLNLRFDRYGYCVGGHRFGDLASTVQLNADWHGAAPLPDLDVLPERASVVGVDLNPVDVADAEARHWLEALVWPENRHQRDLLTAALALVATDPPSVRRGDAIDLCPAIAAELPKGAPRVVFHSATRMHVPGDRVAAFDRALDSLGDSGPLYRLFVEERPDPDFRPTPRRDGAALTLQRPDGTRTDLAVVEGHLQWIEPLAV